MHLQSFLCNGISSWGNIHVKRKGRKGKCMYLINKFDMWYNRYNTDVINMFKATVHYIIVYLKSSIGRIILPYTRYTAEIIVKKRSYETAVDFLLYYVSLQVSQPRIANVTYKRINTDA